MAERRKKYEIKQIVILLALAALFLILTVVLNGLSSQKVDDTGDYSVLNPSGVVKHITVINDKGNFSLSYENSNWYSDEDRSLSINNSEVGIVTHTVTHFEPSRVLSDAADYYDEWGLSENDADKIILNVEGKEYVYYIGKYNVLTGDYYLRSNQDESKAFLINHIRAEMANVGIEALLKK